jgi:hypothetical protein
MGEMRIWFCKIGETPEKKLSDNYMREFVSMAYRRHTGDLPNFVFSGWNGSLTESERAVVEDREPILEALETREYLRSQLAAATRERDEARAECERMIKEASRLALRINALDGIEAECERLRGCLKRTGAIAFMRNGSPEDIAEQFESVRQSYEKAEAKLVLFERLNLEWLSKVLQAEFVASINGTRCMHSNRAEKQLELISKLRAMTDESEG